MTSQLLSVRDERGRFPISQVAKVLESGIPYLQPVPAEGWPLAAFHYVLKDLFPEMEIPEEREEMAALFLQICRGLYGYERQSVPFDPRMDFAMVEEADLSAMEATDEYLRLRKTAEKLYLYEFMRIGSEITPFNTLGHIAGVHYIAMLAARQLSRAGIPVDLGLISGAAAGHDIGKYGCRKSEEARIPYLHYYYTDVCFRRFQMPFIGHIAGNHSVWDLELENLPIESLLLIYADFRVKSTRTQDGEENVHFYTLDESYDVILGKLDNVDQAKRNRYSRVFSKLKDFENYMKEHGVRTDVPEDYSSYENCPMVPLQRDVVLLSGQDVVEQLKYQAIDHNVRLMSRFNSERKFGNLIESARSERQWKNLRTYVSIFDEYSTYMTESQKTMTMGFLRELLSHSEGDIRSQAAEILGRLAAGFSEEYTKELPEGIMIQDRLQFNLDLFQEHLEAIIWPDYKYTEQHKKWIRNSLSTYVRSVLSSCTDSVKHRYVAVFEAYYQRRDLDADLMLTLSRSVMELDASLCTASFVETVQGFLDWAWTRGDVDLQAVILLAKRGFLPSYSEERYFQEARDLYQVPEELEAFQEELGAMFLSDLKAGTSWACKVTNIHFMVRYAKMGMHAGHLLHVATHLANLIKVSETMTVRRQAGEGLLAIMPYLSLEQRNEIAIELYNGLERGDYQFTKFIPEYLGMIMLGLPEQEIDETITDLGALIRTGDEKTASSALNTLGVVVANYDVIRQDFEEAAQRTERKRRILGLVMKAFAGYRSVTSQEAFWVLGSKIFAGERLDLQNQGVLFAHLAKKVLYLLQEKKERDLDFYNNAAVLNKMYRLIGAYAEEYGNFQLRQFDKVCFFPGTFDPFSLGHKAIATTIRDRGMEVYLALDEFSWSKKTQPRLQRRKIAMMSVADEDDIYLFPEDIPVNIANPADIKRLKDTFPGQEVYIAVGSDVIQNASSYRKPPEEHSIHTMHHIAFDRDPSSLTLRPPMTQEEAQSARPTAEKPGKVYPITGKVIHLTLPQQYEDISSTKIRDNIDLNRDISNLIDSTAQSYIYEKNLYLREPEYKHVLQAHDLHISAYGSVPEEVLASFEEDLGAKGYQYQRIREHLDQPHCRAVYLQTGENHRKTVGVAAAHKVESSTLLEEFGNAALAAHVREMATGRIAVLGLLATKKAKGQDGVMQILITEMLTELLARDYTFAIYHPADAAGLSSDVTDALCRQGFVNIAPEGDAPVFAVDMRDPIIVFKDVETVIKSPLNKSAAVLQTIEEAHGRLLGTLTSIFPGKLVLSFHTGAVYSKIMERVAAINQVPTVPSPDGIRGPYMSVPFGKALSEVVVPNTVTKALHTEKYFAPDLDGFVIGERKYYSEMSNQAKTIRSFDRPVILIDDLLHKGHRMRHIEPLLRAHGIPIRAIACGVVTANARDDMAIQGIPVESAYYVPNVRLWLNERDCYPFVGGDCIASEEEKHINLLMPYANPGFLRSADHTAVYRYSMTCLENTYRVLRALEEQYQKAYEKKLTLKRLGEVISYPKLPDMGTGMEYDENLAPSSYVEGAMLKLLRTTPVAHRV